MGLFKRNFNRFGPGVEKDAPRLKGPRRFAEVFVRDFSGLVKLSLLFFLCCLPALAAFVLLLLGPLGTLVPLLALIPAALPVGGAATAMVYCISQMLRDEPAFLWQEFKQKFKENFAPSAIAGMVCTLMLAGQGLFFVQLGLGALGELGLWPAALWAFSLLIFSMVCPYYFVQAAYIALGPLALLKNSLILAFAHLPRSFMGALCGGILWALLVLFFPITIALVPFVPLLFCSLSCLLGLFWVWPVVDKQFAIEETLRKRAQEEDAV